MINLTKTLLYLTFSYVPSSDMVTYMGCTFPHSLSLSFFLDAKFYSLLQISALRDISTDNHDAPKLAVFDIVLGTLYLVTFGLELIGFVGAWLVCTSCSSRIPLEFMSNVLLYSNEPL